MPLDLFDLVSPLDFRYYGADPALVEKLSPFVSERAKIAYELKVESALVATLADQGLCTPEIAQEVEKASHLVTPEEVQAEDRRIKHDVRALVNCLQNKVSEKAKPFIHFGLTSYDVVDTATALRFKDLTHQALLPDLLQLEQHLINICLREKDTLQMGRTHGQHAVPLTFGFALAEYVSRLGNRIENLKEAADNLRGKISGGTGSYNALSLLVDDPEEFEKQLLSRLGLKPSTYSTQIVEPEYLLDYVHALVSCLGVLANLCDDMRHLQRTEISEVGEVFEPEQVGSSTMPHKRNPINFENVKSMWKTFMPRIITCYADQISEHQRDLTNSASQRFVPEIAVALACCVQRLNRVMSRLVVDRQKMLENLAITESTIVSEPLYILLAAQGHPNAHEAVRKLTLKLEGAGKSLLELAQAEKELASYLERLTPGQLKILKNPRQYIGLASQKTEEVCNYWTQRLRLSG